jgi:hypothetical protein
LAGELSFYFWRRASFHWKKFKSKIFRFQLIRIKVSQ